MQYKKFIVISYLQFIYMSQTLSQKIFLSLSIIALFGQNLYAQLPQLRGVDCNRTNTLLTQALYANITNANQYKFKVTNLELGVTDSIIKPVRWFYLNEIPSVSRYNCNYEVSVCMDVGSGFGAYGNTCNPSSIALMSKLRNVDCGKHIPGTLYPFSLGLYANTTTANSWDFQIRNVQDTNYVEDIFGLPTRKFQLFMASNLFQLYNREYQIRVRTTQGGILQPWGQWCSVYTPMPPIRVPNFPDLVSVSSAGKMLHNPSADPPLYVLFNVGETITETFYGGNPQTPNILTQGFEQPSKWSVGSKPPIFPDNMPTEDDDYLKDISRLEISLYPNPYSDKLMVNLIGDKCLLNLEIIASDGRIVKEVSIVQNTQTLHLENLETGTYMFSFKNQDNQLVERIKVIKSY